MVFLVALVAVQFYAVPLVLTKLFGWLFSSRSGYRYNTAWAIASKTLRLTLLFGFLALMLVAWVKLFLKQSIDLYSFMLAPFIFTALCVFKIGWESLEHPNRAVSALRRFAQGALLMVVVMIFDVLWVVVFPALCSFLR